MHMADALLSPATGVAFWVVSGALVAYSAKKTAQEADGSKTPLMGVLGAFVFAAQMINFTIPGTGSSGHLGGGLLLAVLLGPYRAFITLASVLVIQSLFFADGGLLALGCNIFNLAFFPAFVAYPFIYRIIAGNQSSPRRVAAGTLAAATAGLLMGACGVVLETGLSGITELPFTTFLLFMMPIHLVIGLVEGLVTLTVISFIAKTEPALLSRNQAETPIPKRRFIIAAFAVAALVTGGLFSQFASSLPDGLEWSIAKVSGTEKLHGGGAAVHELLAGLQDRVALLPGYAFKSALPPYEQAPAPGSPLNQGASVSGVLGSLCVLALAGTSGLLLRKKNTTIKRG